MTQFRAWHSATVAQALFRACKEKDLEYIEVLRHQPSLLNDRGGLYGGTLLYEACLNVIF